MTLYFRMFLILLLARFRKSVKPQDESIYKSRVWPSDLDILGHMTNSRYFGLMDLARNDFIVRSGILSHLKARGWYPVVVEETMHFRRSLEPFEPFHLKTKVVGADERHILIQQTFVCQGQVAAIGLVRTRFLGPNKSKPTPREVMLLSGHDDFEYPPIQPQEQDRYEGMKGHLKVESKLLA